MYGSVGKQNSDSSEASLGGCLLNSRRGEGGRGVSGLRGVSGSQVFSGSGVSGGIGKMSFSISESYFIS